MGVSRVDRDTLCTEFTVFSGPGWQRDFIQEDEFIHTKRRSPDVASVDPCRGRYDITTGSPDGIHGQLDRVTGIHHIIDHQNSTAMHELILSAAKGESFLAIDGDPFGIDATAGQGQRRELGADQTPHGGTTYDIEGEIAHGFGKQLSQSTRKAWIQIDDVLGDPSVAMIARGIDEVIIFDQCTTGFDDRPGFRLSWIRHAFDDSGSRVGVQP